MAQTSLYDVLLVDQNATLEEIKLAFKRRALQVHPDKGGSKEEFHLVYQALETLGDPATRQKYDQSLATASKKTEAALHPKSKKRKRAGQNAHPPTSCKVETKTKPQTPGKKSTTSAGKAPSRPTQATAKATPAELQSPQAKLLIKIRDLLKRLPRDARNDVITNQFTQKQRVLLERFMVDNTDTSSGTKCHSEAEALAPAATSKINATNQASASLSLTSETSETCATPSLERTKNDVKVGEACFALAVPNSKRRRSLQMDQNSSIRPSKCKVHVKKNACKRMVGSNGCVKRFNPRSDSYSAVIRFDYFEMRAGSRDLKTSLDYLLILTAVKQKMQNHTGAGTFVERLQLALGSCAAEHGCNLGDLKLSFLVYQYAGCFIGSCNILSLSVRSLDILGKVRSVLAPFRQYAKNMGGHNVYWQYSPVHLEDAWERFQSAVAEAWQLAGVDSTAILQKICCLYEAQAPFRTANLQRWEQQHMARQDKNRNRPGHLRERNPSARLERWERQQMAMQDKNKHRPRHLRERNPTASLEYWERGQMPMEDKNKHRPRHLRERNPTASLECWERRQMSTEDKNEHRPKKLQQRNPTRHMLRAERRRMAMEDRNKHRPKKLRQKLDCTSESALSRQLSSLIKLIARWGRMLKRESELLDQQRQRVLHQRRAQQKKDQEERRRVEVVKQKQRREEERLRREWVRKRMRTDLTMDDILGQKCVSNADQND